MATLRPSRFVSALLILAGLSVVIAPAWGADYLSVAQTAVLYDSPSVKGKPLYLIQRYTPVEVVVSLEAWVKVRDADGTIAWIERRSLAPTRSVQTTARAQIRQAAAESAPLVFEADKNVALEWLESAQVGWAKVKHRDGQIGYVKLSQIWGY